MGKRGEKWTDAGERGGERKSNLYVSNLVGEKREWKWRCEGEGRKEVPRDRLFPGPSTMQIKRRLPITILVCLQPAAAAEVPGSIRLRNQLISRREER